MEEKYKKIGKLLRISIDTDYCCDCPFSELCDDLSESHETLIDCDMVRIIAIEKELKKYDKNS